ncbi:hypothetical protein H5410_058393 [Solanum commersonii]|uniref:Uncharacterized protein n=1 Tax=Solanum commersonii TaxID=4109 RepID=A0A9J5WQN0_SOLCO|nr:hypothetical protein H5410_058393 [Solanum commersonii]
MESWAVFFRLGLVGFELGQVAQVKTWVFLTPKMERTAINLQLPEKQRKKKTHKLCSSYQIFHLMLKHRLTFDMLITYREVFIQLLCQMRKKEVFFRFWYACHSPLLVQVPRLK